MNIVNEEVEETNKETVTSTYKERLVQMDLCRVCANVNDQLIPIFEGEGLQHELCDKIHKYLPIRVSEKDILPLQLCYHCAATLLSWHELLEGCVNAERKLMAIQESTQEKEQCITAPLLEPLQTALQEVDPEPNVEEQLLEEQQSVRDGVCKESVANDTDRWQTESNGIVQVRPTKINSTHPQELPYFECSQCDIIFNGVKCLVKHMNINHNILVNYCEYCKLIYHGEHKSFLKHILAHKNIIKKVRVISTYKGEPTREVMQKGGNDCAEAIAKDQCGMYTCNVCEENFTKKSELRKHMNGHAEIKRIQNAVETELLMKAKQVISDRVTYLCDVCKKQIFTKRGFLRHIRVHSGMRPCKCEFCGNSYRIEQDLARHIRDVHEGVKRYACDICGCTFANKGTRDDHRRIHTGERPYACEHCPKTFRTLNSIYIHNRVHSNYKPHKCSYCGKHFRSRQRLTNHETTHTGIKAFSCEICGRAFSVKGEVVRHRAIHNHEKPFSCNCCDMMFAQRRYLRNHIRQRHKEKASLLLSDLLINRI